VGTIETFEKKRTACCQLENEWFEYSASSSLQFMLYVSGGWTWAYWNRAAICKDIEYSDIRCSDKSATW